MNSFDEDQKKMIEEFSGYLRAGKKQEASKIVRDLFSHPLTSIQRGQIYFILMNAYVETMGKVESTYEEILDAMIDRLDAVNKREGEVVEENQKAAARQTISEQ